MALQRRRGNDDECVNYYAGDDDRGRFRRLRRHRGRRCKVAQLLLAGLPAPAAAGDSSEENQGEQGNVTKFIFSVQNFHQLRIDN